MVISLLFNQKEWYIPKHSFFVETVDIQYPLTVVLGIMLYVWSAMINPYEPVHWVNISKLVTKTILPIFPFISSKKLKSEIMSNIFETQSANYFNSIGYNTNQARSDRDPDLLFTATNKTCEIKVTGSTKNPSEVKWMGGKYSKRPSDYIFIIWHYEPEHNTLDGIIKESVHINITQCYANEDDWETVDNGKENYYATVFKSNKILERDYVQLVGGYTDRHNMEIFN